MIEVQKISINNSVNEHWIKEIKEKIEQSTSTNIEIDTEGLVLNIEDLEAIRNALDSYKKKLFLIYSNVPETIVSASSLGLRVIRRPQKENFQSNRKSPPSPSKKLLENIDIHIGTLRSGDDLNSEKNLLFLGDINPGASISAKGNILIWGKLRGTAHAGRDGNRNAKIVALQLRPVQLRIADVIARGPTELPEEGLAEEASINENIILIKPASTEIFSK